MDLELSAEHAAVVDLFESLCGRHSTIEVVRAHEDLGFAPALWDALVSAGAPGMALAEPAGGGAGLLDLALALEVLGRFLAPAPLVEHAVACRLLGRLTVVSGELASGARLATLALRPPVDGVARLVPAGAVAHTVVVRDGAEILAAYADPPLAAVPNLASAPLADRPVRDAVRVGGGPDAVAAYRRAVTEWRALTASALVGLGLGALALGREYVTDRRQFGVPIGSFQAIQHALASAAVALEGAQLLARKAAWALEEERDDAADLAAMALLFASEHAQRTTERVLHFHGGYGFMQEYDIQLYYRRAKGWPLVLDAAPTEYARLAARRYGSPAAAS